MASGVSGGSATTLLNVAVMMRMIKTEALCLNVASRLDGLWPGGPPTGRPLDDPSGPQLDGLWPIPMHLHIMPCSMDQGLLLVWLCSSSPCGQPQAQEDGGSSGARTRRCAGFLRRFWITWSSKELWGLVDLPCWTSNAQRTGLMLTR